MLACVLCLWRRDTLYSGSVILVPTHASNNAPNIPSALRRSAVSVRDVSHSPRFAVASADPDGQTASEMAPSEASGMGKRLSVSTSHIGTRKAQKLSKGTSQAMDDNHVIDTDGKNTKALCSSY